MDNSIFVLVESIKAMSLNVDAQAIYARIEGYKAANLQRLHLENFIAYDDDVFLKAEEELEVIAQELRNIYNKLQSKGVCNG